MAILKKWKLLRQLGRAPISKSVGNKYVGWHCSSALISIISYHTNNAIRKSFAKMFLIDVINKWVVHVLFKLLNSYYCRLYPIALSSTCTQHSTTQSCLYTSTLATVFILAFTLYEFSGRLLCLPLRCPEWFHYIQVDLWNNYSDGCNSFQLYRV